MNKSYYFEETKFDAEFIEMVVDMFITLSGSKDFDEAKVSLHVSIGNES